jgi:molecular chaperone GrpE (heat shock protein)
MSVYTELALVVATVVASYFAKRYERKIKEILILIDTIEKALADGELTEEELKTIIAKIKQIGGWR